MKKKNFIFGTRAVIEAVNSDQDIDKVYIKTGMRNALAAELVSVLKEHEIPFQYVPIQKINSLSTGNHQGVLAYLSQIRYQNIENLVPFWFENGVNPLVLVLDGLTDVRNFGAIARSAECAGANALLIPTKGAAQINADAIKTSAGALNSIPVCRRNDMADTLKFLKNSGFHIVAATEKAEQSYTETDFTGPTAIVMGAEDRGIHKELLAMIDYWTKIPTFGEIESLNVSVAAGIFLFEALRQRKLNTK